MFDVTAVFEANYTSPKKVKVNQGGTSSGKTYAIMQLLFLRAIETPEMVITVVGQDVPNLKRGAYRDAKHIYGDTPELKKWFSKPNETDRIFTCINGSIIEFTSYQDEQDAKSGKRHILFVNEANGIYYRIYWELAMRTRKEIFIDYNPTARFWAHEEVIGKPDCELIISDHRHNTFLTKEEHDKIEGIDDPELFKVYARGLTGRIQGLVYTKWGIVEAMPDLYKKRWCGLDFGFVNDPTALLDVRLSGGELWVDELIYDKGLLNSMIAEQAKAAGIDAELEIVADSAEPKSIAELNNMGLTVEEARKGPDSIKNGIDILRRYKINVTRRSEGLRKELMSYKWKEDKNGVLTNAPVDEFNHALDALRYVALNKLTTNDYVFSDLNEE